MFGHELHSLWAKMVEALVPVSIELSQGELGLVPFLLLCGLFPHVVVDSEGDRSGLVRYVGCHCIVRYNRWSFVGFRVSDLIVVSLWAKVLILVIRDIVGIMLCIAGGHV